MVCIGRWLFNERWLQGVLGTKDSTITVEMWLTAEGSPLDGSAGEGHNAPPEGLDDITERFWLVDHPVRGTATIGELWTKAKQMHNQRLDEFQAEDLRVFVNTPDGTRREVVLRCHETVAATRFACEGHSQSGWVDSRLVFCGSKLDDAMSWGEAAPANGMAAECDLHLEIGNQIVETEDWDPATNFQVPLMTTVLRNRMTAADAEFEPPPEAQVMTV